MSQHCVPWYEEFAIVYRIGCKTHTVDPEELVARYAGLEEASYFDMLHRFNMIAPRRPRPRSLTFPGDPNSVKIRVIRLYATHAPHRVTKHHVEDSTTLIGREGSTQMMGRLTNKYGPEPVTLKDFKTRIRVMLASYEQWDRIGKIDYFINLYEGDEEAYLRRLVSELGPEPQEPDTAESYDYRSRARRFLTLHDAVALARLDNIMSKFENRELELMALLQRRYGKEPTEKEVQDGLGKKDAAYQKQQQELKERRDREAKQRAEKLQQQELQKLDKMKAIGVYNWDTGNVSNLIDLPGNTQRPAIMTQLRDMLLEGRRLREDKCVTFVREILSFYNRPLVEFAEEFIQRRISGDVDERMEFLAFLEHLYINALPLSAMESLRTVLSLLEMRLGANKIEEVKEAGGVNQYLSQVDSASEREWVNYMISVYGHASEDELALMNRARYWLLQVNTSWNLSRATDELERNFDIERSRLKSQHREREFNAIPVLEQLLANLRARYGQEPRLPILVNKNRVLRLLDRNAPGKLAKIDIVLQAHSLPGDSAATTLDRLLRSYGSEQTPFDAVLAKFESEEMDMRYKVWAQQTRLRNIFSRRLKAIENPDMDVLQSVIETTAKYTDLSKQQAAAQAQKDREEAEKAALAKEKGDNDHFEAKTREEALEHEEKLARQQLAANWRQEANTIAEQIPQIATLLDCHIEVKELFARIAQFDDAASKYEAFHNLMKDEEAELTEWLSSRLKWRSKWAADEKANKEKAQREKDKQRILDEEAEEERRRKDTDAANEAAAHFQAMQDLRENLHFQATKVLQYQANLKLLQSKGNLGLSRNSLDIETHRQIHSGCCFNKNPAYNTNVKPLEIVVVDDKYDYIRSDEGNDSELDPNSVDKGSWEYVFKRQCRTYVEQLLKAYDPARLPRLDDIMRRYNNREHDLIAALEQQLDIESARATDLMDRVREYYQRMAPDRTDEVDTILRRFNFQAELIWPFLYTQYGAHPRRRGNKLREYLRQRLGCYLAKVAPKLLPEVDRMIDQCPMLGCESLFRELKQKYKQDEDPQFEIQNMERKLKIFYSKRRMTDVLQHVPAIARRFVGRYNVLNEVLSRMFNDNLDRISEDIADPEEGQITTAPQGRHRQQQGAGGK